MAKNLNKIDNLAELSKHINQFIEEELVKTIEETKSFDLDLISYSGYDEEIKTEEYKVTFVDGLKSFNVKDQHFTNHIKNGSKLSPLNNQILDILNLEDKIVNAKDIPIILDDEVKSDRLIDSSDKKKRDRYNKILSKKGLKLDKTILKTPYKNIYLRQFNSSAPGDVFRVYYQKDTKKNTINIILLDIHHLLATSRQKYISRYIKVKDYNCCIRKLLT